MGNKKVPEIRLEGFSGEWEEKKLGEILKVNSGRDYKHLQHGNVPVYGTGGYMLSVNDKLSDEDAIGIGRKGTIDNPQLLKAPFWTVDTLFYMTTKGKHDLFFCYSLSNKINWKMYDESTGVPSLSKRSIENIPIRIPKWEEQSAIGIFFKLLDDTITLHKLELDTLKRIKQGFLQKMFPKKGESVPEIRFPEFTGEWKKCMLGEILTINSGRDYKHLEEGDIPVYGTGGYMLSVSDKLSDEDAIGIGRKGTINIPQLLKAPFWTVDTLFYMTIVGDNDLLFTYALANRVNWKRYDESTGVPSLSKSSIQKIPLYLPSTDEQQKIGKFFKQLDDTIALHEQELETLKQTKKAFLQKMFV